MNCPDSCQDLGLVANSTAGCPPEKFRKRTLSRIAFMSCGIALPSNFTELNTKPLFLGTTGDPGTPASIVLSSPLANVTWEDPTTEDVLIHDCAAPVPVTTGRILTAEDRIAIEMPTGVLPETGNMFADYDFWKDKKVKHIRLRYGLVFCNGDFQFARDEYGRLLQAPLQAFLAYQKLGNNGGSIEFKKIRLAFQTDPMDFVKPDFNLIDFGIEI